MQGRAAFKLKHGPYLVVAYIDLEVPEAHTYILEIVLLALQLKTAQQCLEMIV